MKVRPKLVGLGNWADNYRYEAERVHRPRAVEEVQRLVSIARKVKALGTRHSFNAIADTTEDLISLEHFDKVVGIDRDRMTVTIEGGVTYGGLCRHLNERGYAIHNLASLPHISVAGACATGTHGSGDRNGNLATSVASMEVVTADGSIVEFTRELNGAAVHLGGLGVVVRLTLDIQPAFEMRQEVFENLPLEAATERFDEIMSSGYSVSLFTHWQNLVIDQVWIKRIEGGAPLDGAQPADAKRHPIREISPANCTEQMGVPGPWHERLPHFRMDYLPSSGKELQSEYLMPRECAADTLTAVNGLRALLAPILQISEIRTVAADELWMSPSYQRASVAIHFTWRQDWEAVRAALPLLEEALAPFQPRPHWGKLFCLAPECLCAVYPRLADFRDLLETHDPTGKFRNSFLDKAIWAVAAD